MRRRYSQFGSVSTDTFGALCLAAAGGLVGLCVRGGFPADASGTMGTVGAGPLLAMLGFFPLLLLIRFTPTSRAVIGGAAWGVGVAVIAAGSDPAEWLAYILGPVVFALIATLLTRRIGFHALIIAVLWLLLELAMMSSGLAPRGMFAALAEGSALFSGLAAWLGSVHVALLLALVAAGVVVYVTAMSGCARRRWPIGAGLSPQLRYADEPIRLQSGCGVPMMPRAPPMRD